MIFEKTKKITINLVIFGLKNIFLDVLSCLKYILFISKAYRSNGLICKLYYNFLQALTQQKDSTIVNQSRINTFK